MKQSLPIILGAGLFNSKTRFPKNAVTPARNVEIYELEYFFEDGGISVVNGKEYPIKSGNLLFARPNDVRYSFLPFRCKFLHFSVSDSELISTLDNIGTVFTVTDSKKINTAFSDISNLFYSTNSFDNITAAAKLISLLHFITSDTTADTSTLSKAQRFIESNYKENITTEIIADACNVSISYLHKLFKNTLNTTPGDYLLNCRISAVKDMLINTNLSLSAIAMDCGFNSQSYFSDCFKKRVGISPKEFRKGATYLL